MTAMRNKKGHFAKGNPGRPKGAKNKKIMVTNAFFEYISKKNLSKFEEELNKLSGKEYVDVFLKISKHYIPKGEEVKYNSALIEFFEKKLNINE